MFCEIPQFARCCFCMPLRKGVLTFGYLNIIFSLLMVALNSFAVHHDMGIQMLYPGIMFHVEAKIGIAIYCVDVVLNALMLYGAHNRIVRYLKIFYYYVMCTTICLTLLEVVYFLFEQYLELELMSLLFVGVCLQLYLMFLVRSLIHKLETSGSCYENQLQQFVNGETKEEGSTVVSIENA